MSAPQPSHPPPEEAEVKGEGRPDGFGWLPLSATLVAIVALVASTWAIADSHSSGAVDAVAGDPTTRVCAAFKTVTEAVPLQTNADLGAGDVAQAAVAANARLALYGGGRYLLNRLAPETPSDLRNSVRVFATNLQIIGMNSLAGIPASDPDQVILMAEGETTRQHIVELCR